MTSLSLSSNKSKCYFLKLIIVAVCVDECINWVVMEKKHFFFFQIISLAVSSFSCGMWDQFPNQGSNLDALHWECGDLATGP